MLNNEHEVWPTKWQRKAIYNATLHAIWPRRRLLSMKHREAGNYVERELITASAGPDNDHDDKMDLDEDELNKEDDHITTTLECSREPRSPPATTSQLGILVTQHRSSIDLSQSRSELAAVRTRRLKSSSDMPSTEEPAPIREEDEVDEPILTDHLVQTSTGWQWVKDMLARGSAV